MGSAETLCTVFLALPIIAIVRTFSRGLGGALTRAAEVHISAVHLLDSLCVGSRLGSARGVALQRFNAWVETLRGSKPCVTAQSSQENSDVRGISLPVQIGLAVNLAIVPRERTLHADGIPSPRSFALVSGLDGASRGVPPGRVRSASPDTHHRTETLNINVCLFSVIILSLSSL